MSLLHKLNKIESTIVLSNLIKLISPNYNYRGKIVRSNVNN